VGMKLLTVGGLLAALVLCACVGAEEARSDAQLPLQLRVFHRHGQVFATWGEVEGEDVTYNLYRSRVPITQGSLEQAELVATGIPQGTGHDFIAERNARFWKRPLPDPGTFIIERAAGPLPPATGLFVYTPQENGHFFYAITAVHPDTGEDRQVRVGRNSQLASVAQSLVEPGPILLTQEQEGSDVRLDYLHWGTPALASVDGHPYRFRVVRRAEDKDKRGLGLIVQLHPYTGIYSQAKWGRPGLLLLGLDDFTPAIPEEYHHSFWFGYRENLGRCYLTGRFGKQAAGAGLPSDAVPEPVPVRDYTRRRIRWTIDGVISHFPVDGNRVYLKGSSMGGAGTVGFGLRHPELFAALEANVPLINAPRSKAWAYKLLGQIWQAENWPDLPDGQGNTLRGRLDDSAYVLGAKVDLPFLKFVNGRRDGAIGWSQIPEFIRAMQKARQPFMCAWHNGEHHGLREGEVPNFTAFDILQIRRDQCVPAFSNASTADDPGSGDPGQGDLVGGINDDFRWEVEKDSRDELVLKLWRLPKSGKHAGVKEATVDVTPRRRQAFRPPAGAEVTVRNVSAEDGSVLQKLAVTVEPTGLFTAPQVRVSLEPGSRLVFTLVPVSD